MVIITIMIVTSFLVGCSPSAPQNTLTTDAPQPITNATPKPSIHLEPCIVGNMPAKCGVLTVYENRATNTGRTIDIHVAVIKASGTNPAPDPIFYVAGGPGASGIENAAYALKMLKSSTEHRDLVLFDQRGTGQSNRMACPRQADESMGLVRFDDQMTQDLRTCLSDLDGDPSAYTTAWGMDDLEDIRVALGYDQINLYGESYGPTAAQVYLDRHGDYVRTAALEGFSLVGVPMFELMPRSSQQALEFLYTRCQADQTCNTAYPNLRIEVEGLLEQLERQPVELSVINPYTSQPVRLTREWLALGIHSLLLRTPTAVQLPFMIHQAYLGDWSGIEGLLSNAFTSSSPKPEWIMMNLTILCHEDWAKARREETTQLSTESYLRYEDVRTYLAPEQVCALIPRPQPEALYDPVTASPVPILMISNQADPQNSPDNLDTAKELYPNSLTLVAPGQGHGYTGFTCREQILADFFENGTTQGLNADCLQQEPLPPFN